MKNLKDYYSVELEDSNSVYGGVSFAGETLGDFVAELGLENQSLRQINKALKECGIKKIK